jgi:hypothetical protein
MMEPTEPPMAPREEENVEPLPPEPLPHAEVAPRGNAFVSFLLTTFGCFGSFVFALAAMFFVAQFVIRLLPNARWAAWPTVAILGMAFVAASWVWYSGMHLLRGLLIGTSLALLWAGACGWMLTMA